MTAFVHDRAPSSRSLLKLVIAVGLALVVMAGGARLLGMVPSLLNPFATKTVDRSEPAVLHALADASEYRAATANYSVIIDVEEDARYLPSFVKGERAVMVAAGGVDASVDLGALDAATVAVDGDTVRLTLPAAVLSDPHLDTDRTRVVDRDRGVLDRLGGVFSDSPTSERELYRLAERKLVAAARADQALLQRAERNTRAMLRSLLGPLGFERVVVTFSS